MEIILSQDVANLGFKDDLVNVKNGYGRNFLIPKGYGRLATNSAKKVLAENLKQKAFKEKKLVSDANIIAESLKSIELKLTAKVAEGGHKLFGSVTTIDIASSLEKAGQSIEKKFISITGGTVKALGKYTASIRLHRDVVVDLEFEKRTR